MGSSCNICIWSRGVALYWFYPDRVVEPYNPADEEIILPKYDTEFYRSIDEVGGI